MSEIVFILGAGASKEAGAPIMGNFFVKAEELLRNNKTGVYKEDFKRIFEARAKLQNVHSKSQLLELDNIESVFAAFEMGMILNRLPEMTEDDVKLLKLSIRRLIFKTLEQTVVFPVRDGGMFPHDCYNSFAKLIKKLNDDGRKKRCSVITFNYDIALDYALNWNLIPADYCLDESKSQGYTKLMKLHGSLNWTKCTNPECQTIIPWEFKDFFSKFNYPPFLDTQGVILDFASLLAGSHLIHCNKNVESEPFIVPPIWNKVQYYQLLSKVWSQAALELSDAENIFVSGFSLTASDLFFRELYTLGTVGKSLIKRFWVFDPNYTIVEDKYKELLGPGVRKAFNSFGYTFTEAIHYIAAEFNIKLQN